MKIKIIFLSLIITLNAFSAEQIWKIAAKKELERSYAELQKQPIKPYYIAYGLTQIKSYSISAAFGNLRTNDNESERILDIDLRVGDYKFDNTHIIRGNPFDFSSGAGFAKLPLDDDEMAVRNVIWQTTDRQYKSAIERLEKAQTNQKVKVQEEDKSADMSKEEPTKYNGTYPKLNLKAEKFEQMIVRLSAKFSKYPWIYNCNVSLSAEELEKHFINTENSDMSWGECFARLFVIASTKAEDGMTLPLYLSYFSFTADGLPSEDSISRDIDNMINTLDSLRSAPMMTTYTGPAILSGEAAGVFFHEIFGHRVEGHREKDPNSSQTFKQSVGKKILPEFISVTFDPTKRTLGDKELSGNYLFDDEGVKGQTVKAVEDGIFKSFLMSRSPIEGFDKSNGHGRKQAGFKSVSRQSNLIVESKVTATNEELRKGLIDECKKQNKEYGLFFKTVQGGFTFTNRTIPNAFNVLPLVVYKVYTDGRSDELVRGVDLIGTPLSTFANITMASKDYGVFNGVCGAESGGVPVSASSPSLLVSTIEVQKKKKSQAKPPLLASPVTVGE